MLVDLQGTGASVVALERMLARHQKTEAWGAVMPPVVGPAAWVAYSQLWAVDQRRGSVEPLALLEPTMK